MVIAAAAATDDDNDGVAIPPDVLFLSNGFIRSPERKSRFW